MSPVKKKGPSGPMNCPILAAQAKFRVHISLDKHTHTCRYSYWSMHTHTPPAEAHIFDQWAGGCVISLINGRDISSDYRNTASLSLCWGWQACGRRWKDRGGKEEHIRRRPTYVQRKRSGGKGGWGGNGKAAGRRFGRARKVAAMKVKMLSLWFSWVVMKIKGSISAWRGVVLHGEGGLWSADGNNGFQTYVHTHTGFNQGVCFNR